MSLPRSKTRTRPYKGLKSASVRAQGPKPSLTPSGRLKASQGLKTGKRRLLRAKVDKELRDWSRKVRERDDYTCQVTGIRDKENNVAHHKAPRSRRPDLRLDVDNGMTVTPAVHRWIHDYPIQATVLGYLSDETYEAAQKGQP